MRGVLSLFALLSVANVLSAENNLGSLSYNNLIGGTQQYSGPMTAPDSNSGPGFIGSGEEESIPVETIPIDINEFYETIEAYTESTVDVTTILSDIAIPSDMDAESGLAMATPNNRRHQDKQIHAGHGTEKGQHKKEDYGFLTDFNGNSGGFRLHMVNIDGSVSRNFWNIKYQAVAEVDTDGTRTKSVDHLQMTPLRGLTPAGNPWVLLSSTNLPANASLSALHTIYMNPTLVTLPDNSTILAANNTLKITIRMYDWPFDSGVGVGVGGIQLRIKISDNTDKEGRFRDSDRQMRMGDPETGIVASLQFEGEAYVDGDSVPQPVAVASAGNIVTLTFPPFGSSLWYDPILMIDSVGQVSGAIRTAVGFASLILSVFAAVGLMDARV